MSTKSTAASSGFPFLSILTLIFITLKLTGYINWSWWWVLAPMWIPLAIFIAVMTVAGIVLIGAAVIDAAKAKS